RQEREAADRKQQYRGNGAGKNVCEHSSGTRAVARTARKLAQSHDIHSPRCNEAGHSSEIQVKHDGAGARPSKCTREHDVKQKSARSPCRSYCDASRRNPCELLPHSDTEKSARLHQRLTVLYVGWRVFVSHRRLMKNIVRIKWPAEARDCARNPSSRMHCGPAPSVATGRVARGWRRNSRLSVSAPPGAAL